MRSDLPARYLREQTYMWPGKALHESVNLHGARCGQGRDGRQKNQHYGRALPLLFRWDSLRSPRRIWLSASSQGHRTPHVAIGFRRVSYRPSGQVPGCEAESVRGCSAQGSNLLTRYTGQLLDEPIERCFRNGCRRAQRRFPTDTEVASASEGVARAHCSLQCWFPCLIGSR